MSTPNVIVLSGHGLNCEEETAYAFELAGCPADIVHIQDIVDDPNLLEQYQILTVPGGFSFGDHTGSGRAYANTLKNHLMDELQNFAERDTLMLGICNGFQILTRLGLLPGTLLPNENPIYLDRWVDVRVEEPESPWLGGLETFSVPIAHGEGRFHVDERELETLKDNNQIVCTYTDGETSEFFNQSANPNGSVENIAGVTSHDGRVFGLMPHPERALFFPQLPHWTKLKSDLMRDDKPLPEFGPGLQIFKNAVTYYEG